MKYMMYLFWHHGLGTIARHDVIVRHYNCASLLRNEHSVLARGTVWGCQIPGRLIFLAHSLRYDVKLPITAGKEWLRHFQIAQPNFKISLMMKALDRNKGLHSITYNGWICCIEFLTVYHATVKRDISANYGSTCLSFPRITQRMVYCLHD
jgi:hypothetical protein